MEVSAWSNGRGTFGIRVGCRNRNVHFDRSWTKVEVEIDGQASLFDLTKGFWNKCPEFRGPAVRDWLRQYRTLDWPTRKPPRFQLLPLGGGRFRLAR
jgi:hypothetical protein